MHPTMNRQEHKTTLTNPSSMMISPQLDNLILRPNLEPKVARHDQGRLLLPLPTASAYPYELKLSSIGWGSRIALIVGDFSNLCNASRVSRPGRKYSFF